MKSKFFLVPVICSDLTSKVSSIECSKVHNILTSLYAPDKKELFVTYNNTMSSYIPFETNEQIIKDISRTFSNFQYFNKRSNSLGYDRLHRLLIALSTYRNIGYVQGINFIAASFLWHCDEEFAFFIINELFKVLKVEENYTDNLIGVQTKSQIFFDEFLHKHEPEVHQNLAEKEILPIMIFAEWIVTLGFSIIPIEHHISLINGLLENKWEFLYHTIANYLHAVFHVVKDLDFGETLTVIKGANEHNIQEKYGFALDWTKILGQRR